MKKLTKKDQIAQAALAIFLQHGIKGTSVDMVVKEAGVSKPTVYNHFQDKSQLFEYVVQRWVSEQAAPAFTAQDGDDLLVEISQGWLNDDATRLYGLCLGEGDRAPEAVRLFMCDYDQVWRVALDEHIARFNLASALPAQVSHLLVQKLLQPYIQT